MSVVPVIPSVGNEDVSDALAGGVVISLVASEEGRDVSDVRGDVKVLALVALVEDEGALEES